MGDEQRRKLRREVEELRGKLADNAACLRALTLDAEARADLRAMREGRQPTYYQQRDLGDGYGYY